MMALLKPFYQGKLDTFCAIYAVLNALRLTHGIRTTKARDILNSTLMSLSCRPADLQAVLNQQTDYISLVDQILDEQKDKMALEIIKPFSNNDVPDKNEFWNELCNWLGKPEKPNPHHTVICRFLRYLDTEKEPINRHWTTIDKVTDDTIHLFDCSHEAEAILNIPKNKFVLSEKDINKDQLIVIKPNSIRFIKLSY